MTLAESTLKDRVNGEAGTKALLWND